MNIDWSLFNNPMIKPGVKLMHDITASGFEAYIVGGTVRDIAMGHLDIHDIDIATNMPIDTIKRLYKTIEYGGGEKHGTVIVVVDGFNYELTQFRTEGTYSDNRRPDSVTFVNDFKEDTKRRDFTINAMGVDCNGVVIDYHGGLDDIKNKKLRTVGNAIDRFTEDSLRILRAVRFASRFGFTVDSDILYAITELKSTVNNTSMERIRDEFVKMISHGGVRFVDALKLMDSTGLLSVVFPELKVSQKLFDSIIRCDGLIPILSVLTHGMSRGALSGFKERVKLDNQILKGLLFISNNIKPYSILATLGTSIAVSIVSDEYFPLLRMVYCALNEGIDSQCDEAIEELISLLPVLDYGSHVSGLIMSEGVNPSKLFGEIKYCTLDYIFTYYKVYSSIPSDEVIISYIKSYI